MKFLHGCDHACNGALSELMSLLDRGIRSASGIFLCNNMGRLLTVCWAEVMWEVCTLLVKTKCYSNIIFCCLTFLRGLICAYSLKTCSRRVPSY